MVVYGRVQSMFKFPHSLVFSPIWCNVVNMTRKLTAVITDKVSRKKKGANARAVRASISFPAEIYETLELMAKEKKVSLAWVVREAAEKYIEDKWPLFKVTSAMSWYPARSHRHAGIP